LRGYSSFNFGLDYILNKNVTINFNMTNFLNSIQIEVCRLSLDKKIRYGAFNSITLSMLFC